MSKPRWTTITLPSGRKVMGLATTEVLAENLTRGQLENLGAAAQKHAASKAKPRKKTKR